MTAADEQPVPPDPSGGLGNAGLVPQPADGVGSTRSTVGSRERVAARPKVREPARPIGGERQCALGRCPVSADSTEPRRARRMTPPDHEREEPRCRDCMYRWGRLAARRPWRVIGAWLVLAVLRGRRGREPSGRSSRTPSSCPGLDSQQAVDLLAAAGSDRGGLTAQVVVTPLDGRATLLTTRRRLRARSGGHHVLSRPAAAGAAATSRHDAASSPPTVAVALIRVQYPVVESLDPVDLENLKALVAEQRGRLDACRSRPAETCSSPSRSRRPGSARCSA